MTAAGGGCGIPLTRIAWKLKYSKSNKVSNHVGPVVIIKGLFIMSHLNLFV